MNIKNKLTFINSNHKKKPSVQPTNFNEHNYSNIYHLLEQQELFINKIIFY